MKTITLILTALILSACSVEDRQIAAEFGKVYLQYKLEKKYHEVHDEK